jgi:hypothetical protein
VHRAIWDPLLFNLDKLFAALHHLIDIEGGNAQLDMRVIHSLKVLVGPKQDHLIIDCPVRLGSLKTLDGIVH